MYRYIVNAFRIGGTAVCCLPGQTRQLTGLLFTEAGWLGSQMFAGKAAWLGSQMFAGKADWLDSQLFDGTAGVAG